MDRYWSDGTNRYLYAANAPLTTIDPSGTRIFLLWEMDDGLAQLDFLCPDLLLKLNGNYVEVGDECPCSTVPVADNTKFPVSCGCICKAIKREEVIYVHIYPMTASKLDEIVLPTAAQNPAFANGVNGPKCPNASRAPQVWPHTGNDADEYGFDNVWSPSRSSRWQSYAFDKSGVRAFHQAEWRVLAHELCGHAVPHLPSPQPEYGPRDAVKWNREWHDSTIDIENAVAKEHGDANVRGHFADVPGCGESAAYLPSDQTWFWPEQCLPKNLSYPS